MFLAAAQSKAKGIPKPPVSETISSTILSLLGLKTFLAPNLEAALARIADGSDTKRSATPADFNTCIRRRPMGPVPITILESPNLKLDSLTAWIAMEHGSVTVSYTHLTLPTICSV